MQESQATVTECRTELEEVQKALAACKEDNAVLTDTLKEQASKMSSHKVCLHVSHGMIVCRQLKDKKTDRMLAEATSRQSCAPQSSLLRIRV